MIKILEILTSDGLFTAFSGDLVSAADLLLSLLSDFSTTTSALSLFELMLIIVINGEEEIGTEPSVLCGEVAESVLERVG